MAWDCAIVVQAWVDCGMSMGGLWYEHGWIVVRAWVDCGTSMGGLWYEHGLQWPCSQAMQTTLRMSWDRG